MMAANPKTTFGTQSVNGNEIRVFETTTEYVETRKINYGDLVSQLADKHDVTAAEAKRRIAVQGIHQAHQEVTK